VPVRLDRCPWCAGPLAVRCLYCPNCRLELRAEFEAPPAGPFARLTPEQQAFLRLFVASRGNLSDVERTLGVSYPTVRAKLDELIDALSSEPQEQPPERTGAALTRHEVLARIADGRLSAEEGLAILKRLRP
jgi:hypothetical protein